MVNGTWPSRPQTRIPRRAALAVRDSGLRPTRFFLVVSVAIQRMSLFEYRQSGDHCQIDNYALGQHYIVSTSKYGTGQVKDSKCTPLGLHRISRKIGAGQPIGTVFRSREPVGLTWNGQTDASIVHRILWLEGLEEGCNRGGQVDSLQRYIYIHGFGDETTLGRPSSHGCIHMAASDLMPLFDRVPAGTLVWIGE
jgi:L,D-transpeptidase YbiS